MSSSDGELKMVPCIGCGLLRVIPSTTSKWFGKFTLVSCARCGSGMSGRLFLKWVLA